MSLLAALFFAECKRAGTQQLERTHSPCSFLITRIGSAAHGLLVSLAQAIRETLVRARRVHEEATWSIRSGP